MKTEYRVKLGSTLEATSSTEICAVQQGQSLQTFEEIASNLIDELERLAFEEDRILQKMRREYEERIATYSARTRKVKVASRDVVTGALCVDGKHL